MKKYNEFVKLNELLAEMPIDMKNVDSDKKDKEILRLGIIAELDAVNFYEQLADSATNKKVKEMLLDVAKEEKTHVGEFQALLKELDPEYKEELKKGKEEYKESKEKEEEDDDDKKEDKKDETVQK